MIPAPKFQIGETVICIGEFTEEPREFLWIKWTRKTPFKVEGEGVITEAFFNHHFQRWNYRVPALCKIPFAESCLRKKPPLANQSFSELMSSLGGGVVA